MMKNIKIITLLIFLMGGFTTFSQQATSGSQTIDPGKGQDNQEQSTLSPNPVVAQAAQPSWSTQVPAQTTADQPGSPDLKSTPNKPYDPAMAGQAIATPAPVRTEEYSGSSPNKTTGQKPDTQ